jgi:hypothetical protein
MAMESIAHQDFTCDWCGEPIHKNSKYVSRCRLKNGLYRYWRFHIHCTYNGGYMPKSMLKEEK